MARKYRYPSVVDVAAVLITARHWLPWEREAPTRHAIRAMLVLQGMRWERADWLGHSLVARARIENGVRQPRGWDSDADLSQWLPDCDNPCPICGKPFVRTFLEQDCCSTACMNRRGEIEAWCVARVGMTSPPRCKFCWQYFEPDIPWQQFCTTRCKDHATKLDQVERADQAFAAEIAAARRTAGWTQAELARRVGIHERYLGSIEEGRAVASGTLRDRIFEALKGARTERLCKHCGGPIPPDKDPRAKYCCRQHAFDFHNAKKLKRPNGQDHAPTGSAADARLNGSGSPGSGGSDQVGAGTGAAGAARVDPVSAAAGGAAPGR